MSSSVPRPRITIEHDGVVSPRAELKDRILTVLANNKKPTLLEIANLVDASPARVEDQIKLLIELGHNIEVNPNSQIEISQTIPKKSNLVLSTEDYFDKDGVIRFGFVSDTHLASKYARLDVLNALYDVFAKEGITTVYHGGNWIDGDARFNKYDVFCIMRPMFTPSRWTYQPS